MSKLKRTAVAASALSALLATGEAQATLFDRGGGMIYDDVLDITWLQDWNYAQTSGYDIDGKMTWADAKAWAEALVYGGYDDWRLPDAFNADGTGPCIGFNCSTSEIGHMFFNNWGATANNDFSTGTNAANLALFTDVKSSAYRYSTESLEQANWAFVFTLFDGAQFDYVDKTTATYAVAVLPGDVAVVPEPQALGLALVGLGVLAAVGRRRPH